MQISISKTKMTATIAIILLMTSLTLIANVPVQPAQAQLSTVQPYIGPLKAGDTPNVTVPTRAYLSFRPNPIGVGQSLLVNLWINPAGNTQNIIVPEGGFVITFTKPDGTKYVVTIRSEPATFANYFEYIPDQVGQWTVKFEFLGAYFPYGQYYNGVIVTNSSGYRYTVSAYFNPCSTEAQNLTVQQDMRWSWPLTMPTDYWTRPASLNNRGWWPILGNWPATGYNGYNNAAMWDTLYPNTPKQLNAGTDFTPWVQAPNTAHVLWKKLGAIAGLIGGPATQYGTTSSPGSPSLIYAGRCYQTMTIQDYAGNMTSCAVCYDLRTGQQYYAIPISQGGITPNLISYVNPVPNPETLAGEEIGSSTWSVELLSISGSYLRKINPYTGAMTLNASIAPLSGGTFMNQIGGYVLNVQDLGVGATNATGGRYRLINWTTRGTTANLTVGTTTRIISNTSYARSSLPTMQDYENDLGAEVTDTYAVSTTVNLTGAPFGTIAPGGTLVGVRWWVWCAFYKLSTGVLLYNISTDTYPDILYQGGATNLLYQGKVWAWTQGGYYIIFDGFTGKWVRSEATAYPWSSAGFGAYDASAAYGLVLRYSYAGVYAFNATDGKIVWNYRAPALAPFESPYIENGTEIYSFNSAGVIADGKLYVLNSEHSTTWPMTRGWGIHCINMTDGTLVWKLDNAMSPGGMADGYMTFANSWDGYMYVIGKGTSKTTVTGPDVAVPLGTGVVIKGTVLDQSPAQPDTPCVSKDSMSQQMEYLHLSQPIGGLWNNVTVTGVPVSLIAIDSNGTVTDLGTVTSNGYSGVYSVTWCALKEDTYQIIATFAGDDSYGSSMSTTTVLVGPAPAAYPEPKEPIPPTDNTSLLYGTLAAVIIAIIVGIVAVLLALRKH